MNNLNEKCLLLYNDLSTRKGIKRTKLTKTQLAKAPYTLTCDSFYIGGSEQTDEIVAKGAILTDKNNGRNTVCLLVRDLKTDYFFIKVLNVKSNSSIGLDNIIKISYDESGAVRQDCLRRKESVYKGSLSAFCKPPSLQDVTNYVTSLSVGLA